MQRCAIPTPFREGGPPQSEDPVGCQAAETACFAACER